jgi:hypothetical protein
MACQFKTIGRFSTVLIFSVFAGFSMYLLFLIVSSATSGCYGDMLSCRPDPLVKTFHKSGRTVLSIWEVGSVEDGAEALVCGYVPTGGTRMRDQRYSRNPDRILRLDRRVPAGAQCVLGEVGRVIDTADERRDAFPTQGRFVRGTPVLKVKKILPAV